MQTNNTDSDEMNRDTAAPPLLNAIPESVIEAMGLVMKEAEKAASEQLESAKVVLATDRAAFEVQRANLETELSETKTALAAEKAAHQQAIDSSESLRIAAQQHEEIVNRLTRERDEAQALSQDLKSEKSDLQKGHQSKGAELQQLNAQIIELRHQLEDLQQSKTQLEAETARLAEKDVSAAQEQSQLTLKNRELTTNLIATKETLTATEKRRMETVDRFKKAQLEIFTLKAQVSDMVSELKLLKHAPPPSVSPQE